MGTDYNFTVTRDAFLQSASDWVGEDIVSAVYPCAGQDTKALTFTHPEFLQHRLIEGVPAPNTFIYIDKEKHHLDFSDQDTEIVVSQVEGDSFYGIEAQFYQLTWRSLAPQDWLTLTERNIFAAYIVADWRCIPGLFYNINFVPDYFIGVCDGCRFGGNDECVNELTTRGLSREDASKIPVSHYYITDHFIQAEIPNPCRNGDTIFSCDARFPFSFRKLALLSSDWGHYGGGGPLRGATLFQVCKNP